MKELYPSRNAGTPFNRRKEMNGFNRFHLLLVSLLALLPAACGNDGDDTAINDRPAAATSNAPEAAREKASEEKSAEEPTVRIKVKTPDDGRVAEFKLYTERVKVEIGEEGSTRVLRGEMREGGKRKYEIDGGRLAMEVKADADAFKVRTPDGKLLWKVKLDADKIKISNNEENLHPYVLKEKGDDVDVEEDGTPLGEVKFYSDRNKMKVKDAAEKEVYESNTERRSAAYGLLLMQGIPEAERYVIMAELLARGR